MNEKSCWQLFKSVFIISTFTFGGGYVIVPLLQKKFVEDLKWISKGEMIDMVAIAQAAPGVMAVNTAIIIGQKIAGLKGAIVATLGTIVSPFFILVIVSYFYETLKSNPILASLLEGMQIAVAAIIIATALNMFKDVLKVDKKYNVVIVLIVFILNFVFKISVFYLIIGAIVLSILTYLVKREVSK